MKSIVIFNIHNVQEEYAHCLKFIESNNINDAPSETYITITNKNINITFLKNLEEFLNNPNNNSSLSLNDMHLNYKKEYINKETKYLFYVRCKGKNEDIVNLQYYVIIRQHHDNCFLYIRSEAPGDESEIYNKASQYFEYVLEKGKYFGNFAEGPVTLRISNPGALKKFSPLIEINVDAINFWFKPLDRSLNDFWRQAQKNDLASKYGLSPDKNGFPIIEPIDIINRKMRLKSTGDIEKRDLIKLKNTQYELTEINKHYQLIFLCKEYFCSKPNKDIHLTEKRKKVFESDFFYQATKNMPLLSFYLYCIFDYYNKEENYEADILLIKKQILFAREICDGLLQLVENTAHYAQNGKGCFSFRIHTTQENEDNVYLLDKYEAYMDERNKSKKTSQKKVQNNKDKEYYLEIQVVDFSRTSIPDKFIDNVMRRQFGLYQKLNNALSKITLKSFFNPTPEENQFWIEYNKTEKNVIHHYGLQLFDSVISSNGGCFTVSSSKDFVLNKEAFYTTTKNNNSGQNEMKIPGTQYSIVLPLSSKEHQINTGLNVNITYRDSNIKYEIIDVPKYNKDGYQEYYKKIANIGDLQSQKEAMINIMSEEFDSAITNQMETKYKNPPFILYCEAISIQAQRAEFFCKSVMAYLVKNYEKVRQEGFYLVITDCTEEHFIEIVRFFAIFYNKQGENPYMQNVQIYLSGKDPCEEFLLSGTNIKAAITRTEKLAFTRCVHPNCIQILKDSLIKRPCSNLSVKESHIVPFDLIEYKESEPTIFELGVEEVLSRDAQKVSFGCSINNTHMRIGSKIHINRFYEAELLFHNNFYTSRFADMLVRKLLTDDKLIIEKDLVLVGYETYSEMLLYEVLTALKKDEKGKMLRSVHYIIYEERENKKFRYFDNPNRYRNAQYVLVVPINSTLTTHNKLYASLKKEIDPSKEYKPDILANFAVVLIRDNGKIKKNGLTKQEERFWAKLSGKMITVRPLLSISPDVQFFVSAKTKWETPLDCKKCFPKDFLQEEPLVETNRQSIIPVQKIGLIEEISDQNITSSFKSQEENEQRVQALRSSLIYKHIKRKRNHYNYYFLTTKYFVENKEDIITWMKSIVPKQEDQVVYDIIVSPLHFSNSGFVDEINNNVFKKASLILHFDVEKEFRDNIRTKYANMYALYINLKNSNEKAIINFHFVDDSIVSGTSLYRAKSLIRSIFPQEAFEQKLIKINIFESIILLINRSSNATKSNYIEDINKYYSYVDLNISSMRNHDEDACISCKYIRDSKSLAQNSSTNEMNIYWERQAAKHGSIDAENMDLNQEPDLCQQEFWFKRMYCTHRANTELYKLGYLKNEKESVKGIILKLAIEQKTDKIEYLISYIKVFSRPFLNFSKSTKEAIFEIMLHLIEYLLSTEPQKLKENNEYKPYKKVFEIIDPYLEESKKMVGGVEERGILKNFMVILMKRLSNLGSNFIIRKDSFRKLFAFCNTYHLDNKDFEFDYLSIIKKIVSLSNDEVKATWLEHLLLFGQEYPHSNKQLDEFGSIFMEMLFIENTRVLFDGIIDLIKNNAINNATFEEELNNYYYENFLRIVKWNFDQNYLELIKNIVEYNSYLNEENNEPSTFYHALSCKIKTITNAEEAQVILHSNKDDGEYYSVGCSDEYESKNMLNRFRDIFSGNDGQLILGTYALNTEKGDGLEYAIIKLINQDSTCKNTEQQNKQKIEDVYFFIIFKNRTRRQLIQNMRNILIFRAAIINKLEKDFSNNSIQEFLSYRKVQDALTEKKASFHGAIKQRLEYISKMLEDTNYSDAGKESNGYMLTVFADITVSELYRLFLRGERIRPEAFIGVPFGTCLLCYDNIFTLKVRKDKGKYITCKIDSSDLQNQDFCITDEPDLTSQMLLLLLILNAGKHCRDNFDNITIQITKTNNTLRLRSRWCQDFIYAVNECKKIIRNIGLKVPYGYDIGITLWSVNQYCKCINGQEINVYPDYEEDTGVVYYNIELPLLKEI